MFKKIYLDPENRRFSDIMSNNRRYIVPPFQRDYSWEDEQWEELWEDIEQMQQSQIQHFMGYLVLQTEDGKSFQIIDGQQRITTVSIIILAVLKTLQALVDDQIDKKANEQRIEEYKRTYIGVFDSITLTTSPKLVLNRHNNQHFRAMVERLEVPTRRRLTKTNRALNRAFEFFVNKLSQKKKDGRTLATLVGNIADGLLFTAITVKDDLNAYTVFETLNARGVHLATPDLLKNYLLSTFASHPAFYTDENLDDFAGRWQIIIEQLGETEFTNFLRSHRGMTNPLPHKRELYRLLRREIDTAEKVIPYLEKLEDRAPVYAALQEPHDDFWKEREGRYIQARPHLEALKLFGIKTPLSLLMAGYERFLPQEFIKLLNCIEVLTLRYNVICNLATNDQERMYNITANQLINEDLSLQEVMDRLRPIYPHDIEVRQRFGDKSMPSRRSNKKIMFLLREIEMHLSGRAPQNLTLEHVLPYNPEDDWQAYFGRETYENAIDRLGNMALLPSNQNMGQEVFEQKREILQASEFRINRHIAEYPEWNMNCLEEHQRWLAKQATAVWKISEYA